MGARVLIKGSWYYMLNMAEPTVKNHITAILKALKVTNRTEAVLAVGALNWKLPQVEEPK